MVILYPFSIQYVWKLDSWTHILQAFGLAVKPSVMNLLDHGVVGTAGLQGSSTDVLLLLTLGWCWGSW
jgi:hypothetical protein